MPSDKNVTTNRPVGSAQLYVLQMACPEWPTRSPDARSLRVLRALESRRLVYENRGRWYASAAGRVLVEQHLAATASGPSNPTSNPEK